MAVILGLSTLLTVVSYLIAHVHGYFLIGGALNCLFSTAYNILKENYCSQRSHCPTY